MADVELELDDMTVSELLAVAAGVASALKENEHFPEPEPSPEIISELTEALAAADEARRRQSAILTDASISLERAAEALRSALAREAAYVQRQSGGSIQKILSANLHVEEETSFWPFNRIGDVENLNASMGDQPGEIDLSWDPVSHASGYEVEIAVDLNGDGPWEQSGATTQSKLTIEKLNNRTRYWFRVRAVGERGCGAWSTPVTKFAR